MHSPFAAVFHFHRFHFWLPMYYVIMSTCFDPFDIFQYQQVMGLQLFNPNKELLSQYTSSCSVLLFVSIGYVLVLVIYQYWLCTSIGYQSQFYFDCSYYDVDDHLQYIGYFEQRHSYNCTQVSNKGRCIPVALPDWQKMAHDL